MQVGWLAQRTVDLGLVFERINLCNVSVAHYTMLTFRSKKLKIFFGYRC